MKEVEDNQVILCRVGTRQHGGLAFVSLFPSRGLFVFLSPYFPLSILQSILLVAFFPACWISCTRLLMFGLVRLAVRV